MPVTQPELEADATGALLDAVNQTGLGVHIPKPGGPDVGVDLLLQGPRGALTVQVKAASSPIPSRIEAMIHGAKVPPSLQPPDLIVLVADEIPAASRQLLRENGWGYLDRRGRLWLRAAGIIVNDTEIKPLPRLRTSGSTADPLGGRAGRGIALAMLMHPHEAFSVRGLARAAECSPSMAHKALTQLQGAALIRPNNSPLLPELFWALADAWRPERHYVSREPHPGDLHQLPGEGGDVERWVISNDVAAASWGAPVVVHSSHRADFYIPGVALTRAIRLLGPAEPEAAGASLAAAPSPPVLVESFDSASIATPWLQWRVAHPVIVALDLAQDRSRGREMIEDWNPPAEFVRVW